MPFGPFLFQGPLTKKPNSVVGKRVPLFLKELLRNLEALTGIYGLMFRVLEGFGV